MEDMIDGFLSSWGGNRIEEKWNPRKIPSAAKDDDEKRKREEELLNDTISKIYSGVNLLDVTNKSRLAIKEKGAKAIADALKTNDTLTKLNLAKKKKKEYYQLIHNSQKML